MPVDGKVHPCLFLKLNKIWNFRPKGIKAANVDDPEYDDMSKELKEIIRTSNDTDQVYIDCKGRFPADVEGVSLEYFPANRAIPTYFFPFSGGNYQSPLVAVKVRAKVKLSLKTVFTNCVFATEIKHKICHNSIVNFSFILLIFSPNNLSVKSLAK